MWARTEEAESRQQHEVFPQEHSIPMGKLRFVVMARKDKGGSVTDRVKENMFVAIFFSKLIFRYK